MNREERAKQFMPFDAVKGLQEALRLVEYEHDKMKKGDMPLEQIYEISSNLSQLKNGDLVQVKYFFDGYQRFAKGVVRVFLIESYIMVETTKINLCDILDIHIE